MMVWCLVRPLGSLCVAARKFHSFCPPGLRCRPRAALVTNFAFNKSYCIQIQDPDIVECEDPVEKIVRDIAKDDKEIENKMRLFLLEIDVLHQSGRKAPTPVFMKKQYWEHLLTLNSRNSRTRYLEYLFKLEMKNINSKAKKELSLKSLEAKREGIKQMRQEQLEKNEIPSVYGIQDLSMFLRIYETSINKTDNLRLHMASIFGQKIIIDCSYDNHMNYREQSNAGNQLTLLFADNRMDRDPFDIHFCNVNLQNETFQKVQRNIPTMLEPHFPMNVHKESYLDLFPKEKLVYLTPHCRTEMTSYDPDAYYIIGCMIDKSNAEPLSLAKAKEHNIKTVKLPLDRYLQWNSGSCKSLTLNQMLKILSVVKQTGDWVQALNYVPTRKTYQKNSEEKMLGLLKSNVDRKFSYKPRFNPDNNRSKMYSSTSDNWNRSKEFSNDDNKSYDGDNRSGHGSSFKARRTVNVKTLFRDDNKY